MNLLSYPATLPRDTDGSVIAQFRDVPEALTHGTSEDGAATWAQDALMVALPISMDEGRDIPVPSKAKRGERMVPLPAMSAAKLAIYQAMRERRVRQLDLAQQLNIDAKQVRRLLDLNHNSTLPQLSAALEALGKRLVVDVRDAA